jgi:hypothetical protein
MPVMNDKPYRQPIFFLANCDFSTPIFLKIPQLTGRSGDLVAKKDGCLEERTVLLPFCAVNGITLAKSNNTGHR